MPVGFIDYRRRRMMKGGKDEKKIMSPLFPRLHINDVEKGGPRAPPRNKMALYEQLTSPTPKCSTGQTLLLPLPPINENKSVPSSLPSSLGGEIDSTAFHSFSIPPPTPCHSNVKLHPLSYDVLFTNTTTDADLEQKSMITAADYYTSPIDSIDLSWAIIESDCLQPQENDCKVPAFIEHSMITTQSSIVYPPHSIDRETEMKSISINQPAGCSTAVSVNSMPKTATNNFSSSMQRNSRDKQLKRTNTTDLTSRQHGRNSNEGNLNEPSSSTKEMQKLASESSIKDHASETLKPTYDSLNKVDQNSPVENIWGGVLENIDSQLHQEFEARPPKSTTVGSNDIVLLDLEKANVLRGDTASCSRTNTLSNDYRSCNDIENGRLYSERKAQGSSSEVQTMNRNDDDSSETSMVDSASRLELSPDDVVGAIGHEHFWKARKILVNQRRLFEMQVFELHRLIKVQRSIASLNITRKKLPSEPILKSQPQIKATKDSLKPKQGLESSVVTSAYGDNLNKRPQIKAKIDSSLKPKQGPESAVGTTSGSGDNVNRQRASQSSSYGSYSGNLHPIPVPAGNNTVRPWYFHQSPGNHHQVLLPVMSPTEGLVYRPMSGAFPPTAGFMSPIYGGWAGPMTVPSAMTGAYQNPGFGFPGFAPMYPPFINVVNSASPHQNGSPWVEAWADNNQPQKFQTQEINHNISVNRSRSTRN